MFVGVICLAYFRVSQAHEFWEGAERRGKRGSRDSSAYVLIVCTTVSFSRLCQIEKRQPRSCPHYFLSSTLGYTIKKIYILSSYECVSLNKFLFPQTATAATMGRNNWADIPPPLLPRHAHCTVVCRCIGMLLLSFRGLLRPIRLKHLQIYETRRHPWTLL